MYFYSAMSFTFPKKEKLKSKKLIEQLFVEGKSVSQYPIKLIYLKVDQQEALIKAGVAVPKKKFKTTHFQYDQLLPAEGLDSYH